MKNNNNCVVFKLDERLHKKFMEFYDMFKCDKFPPYSKFQAKSFDVVITLYEKGKVMFQGLGAENEAEIWMVAQKKLTGKDVETNNDKKKDKDTKKSDDDIFFNTDTIGSDETGCGDFFGPVVVVASYVSYDNISYMRELGVKDSKKITDDKIKEIAPKLAEKIPYVAYVLDNKTYNETYKDVNMVKLKCILHNKVLCQLVQKYNPSYKIAIIDEFVNKIKYYEYLKDVPTKLNNIAFYTKGESKCMSVAASSIIARYLFLREMNKLEKETGYVLPKGAGELVDKQIKVIVNEKGKDYLRNIAKINFNNYNKI